MTTRKHYEAVARMIHSERDDAQEQETRLVVDRIASRMADIFGNDNPRFDRDRFLRACGTVR